MFCQAAGTSLESPDLSYLWGPATHVDRVCLKFHCFVIRWFSLLKRLNFIALSSLYPITGHVFTLITPPPLIVSVVQSAACVQVYSTVHTSVLHRCLQLHSGHLHSAQPTRICRKRFHIAKGLQSYFAGPGGHHPYSSYLDTAWHCVGCSTSL